MLYHKYSLSCVKSVADWCKQREFADYVYCTIPSKNHKSTVYSVTGNSLQTNESEYFDVFMSELMMELLAREN